MGECGHLSQPSTTHVVVANQLNQKVSHQRLPVFGRQALLQCVPEHKVALQHLVHRLQVGLTGEEEEELKREHGNDAKTEDLFSFLPLLYYSLLRPGEDYLHIDLEHAEWVEVLVETIDI